MMGTDDACEAVMVGDRDRLVAESGGGHHQLVGMRSPAQKREICGDLQLRVGHGRKTSGKDAMDKPARRAVMAMQTRPEQPEAPPLLVLDPVIIADRIG